MSSSAGINLFHLDDLSLVCNSQSCRFYCLVGDLLAGGLFSRSRFDFCFLCVFGCFYVFVLSNMFAARASAAKSFYLVWFGSFQCSEKHHGVKMVIPEVALLTQRYLHEYRNILLCGSEHNGVGNHGV